MPPPRGATLSGPELAQLRRCLLTVEHQVEALRGAHDPERIAVRLEEALSGARYLLERAEARQGVH